MKKKLLTAILYLAVSFALSACGDNSTDGTTIGKIDTAAGGASQVAGPNMVVITMGSEFSTLDPRYVYEKHPPLIVNACYENLLRSYSNDSASESCLTDIYGLSKDGLTLTVRLRQDMIFASNSSMASADVLFSIDHCKNLQGNPSFTCDTIESMEAPDNYTVVFHLTQPGSAILPRLTYSSTAVLDSAVMKEHGGADAEDASPADTAQSYLDTVSAGSDMYVMTNYIPGQEIVLEKNPNYRGETTNIDKFIIKIQPNANAQTMTLSGRDTGVAMNMTDDTMSGLEGAESISTINGTTKTAGFVIMNMDEVYGGPASNPQVQNAIRKALNYTGIQIICGSGTITPYDIIRMGFMGGKGEKSAGYTNLEEARALLVEAGHPDGFGVDLAVTDLDMEGTLLIGLTQKIEDDLPQIGINVNIASQPWAVGRGDAYRDGTLGFTVMHWGTDYNDPNVQLEFLPGGVVGKGAGRSTDTDPELVAMYEKTMSATDSDTRIAVSEEVQDAVYGHGPFIMVAQAPSHIGYSTRLEGVAISDSYALDLALVNVK